MNGSCLSEHARALSHNECAPSFILCEGKLTCSILRHLVQYSPLIAPATRTQLLSAQPEKTKEQLITELNNSSIHFPLSQFPHLLSGAITFPVPVFTVYGLIEDVHIVEKFRTGEYEVANLTVIDEASTALIETGGLKLRLLGLGGALAFHKLCEYSLGTFHERTLTIQSIMVRRCNSRVSLLLTC